MNRISKSGGGVGLYLRDYLKIKTRSYCYSNSETVESVFVELDSHYCRYSLSTTTSNVHDFLEPLEQILSVISKQNKPCYIMGNYNLTKHQHHPAASEYIDLLFSCMFHPLKTKPTRLACNSATLIDNILTNDISSTGSENGLIINDLSDHHPVFLLAYTFTSQKNSKQRIVTREFNDSNVTKFSSLLHEFDWSIT